MIDLENLDVLDPSRDTEPTEAQWARSRAFINRTVTEAPPRRAPVGRQRLLVAGAVAVAVGAIAAVVVPTLVPRTAEKAAAAWTAVPTARTGDQVLPAARRCATALDLGRSADIVRPADVLLAEQRGPATMIIMRTSTGHTVECYQTGDHRPSAELLGTPDQPPLPAPAGKSVESWGMGTSGSGADAMTDISGRAGPQVTAIELHLVDGRTVYASVANGWWGAWWPGEDYPDHVPGTTVVVHAGGATTSYPLKALEK